MKEVATENFQRIRDAYEILSDENKRQIYDIYGMEGLNSGLELGPKLTKPQEIKEQLERLRRRKEEEKLFVHTRPNGSIIANFSVPQYLNGGGIMRGYIVFPILVYLCLYSLRLVTSLGSCLELRLYGNFLLFYPWLQYAAEFLVIYYWTPNVNCIS